MSLSPYKEIFSHPEKPLREHLEGVGEIAKRSVIAIPSYFLDKEVLADVSNLIGLYHDIGKATPFFQEYIREENPDRRALLKNKEETKHSLISSIATYFAIEEHLKNFDKNLSTFLPIVSFLTVRRHHTNLQSVLEDLKLEREEILKKQVDNLYSNYLSFLPYWEIVYEKLRNLPTSWSLKKRTLSPWLKQAEDFHPYLIFHLLYSILLDADKHEVSIGKHLRRKSLPQNLIESYRKWKGFDRPQKEIDRIRNEIYEKVLSQVEKIDLDNDHILSFSAPTGAGKTLTVLSFAVALRNRIQKEKKYSPRIIYSLPFLSIIDQNATVIEDIFQTVTGVFPTSDLFLKHHHLSEFTFKSEDTEYGSDESEILIEGWESELIITTFVQLFHTLFTNRNRAIRKFHRLCGSIVILDEIQSFPHKYWLLFKKTAESMAKYLGTFFILTTATQPAIFDNPKELLPEKKKYFELFKRSQLKINIDETKTISEYISEIIKSLNINSKNTLIVLNTIRSAERVFREIKEEAEKNGYEVYFLSSHLIPKHRLERINKIKNSTSKKLVVSTQLIEAGVDIDFEKVIRDLGPFDSINQVTGRANRNLRFDLGEVEIICLRDDKTQKFFYSYIYDIVLIENTKRILKNHTLIQENILFELNSQYYQEILKTMSDDYSLNFLQALRLLNYEKIGKFEIFIEKGHKTDIFIEIDDSASEIWQEYQNIVNIYNPLERKRKFLSIKSKFYNYVVSVLVSAASKNLPSEVSGIRFVSQHLLENYYDPETGFKTEGNEFAIY